MGRAVVHFEDHLYRLPLSTSTRIGRHWSNDGVIELRDVPLYWIEIRWTPGGWMWRPLSAIDRTRGPGRVVRDSWRLLSEHGDRGGPRIHLGAVGWVEVVDLSPPEVLLEDLASGHRLEAADLGGLVTIRADGTAWTREETPRGPLEDGQVLLLEGRAVRVHVPSAPTQTVDHDLDLTDPDLVIEIDAASLQATFTVGPRDVQVEGEPVRVLAVYGAARETDLADEGWVETHEAFRRWVARGGLETSPIDRLAWERGKLRTLLEEAGARGAEDLFEWRRVGTETQVRLVTEAVVID